MIPADFRYEAPTSLEAALQLLAQYGDEAKILAGGHSLLPLMKLRLAAPGVLIDLGRIAGLEYIEERDGYLAIGAMTTHHAVETSELLRRTAPLLVDAASVVGDMQVRNRGTIGGSLAHADPAADLPAAALALDASVVARSPRGEREIPVRDLFVDIWTTTLEPDEIVTEMRVARVGTPAHAYEKFRQRAADWALVGVAVHLERDGAVLQNASVVLVNVAGTPVHAGALEEALRSEPVSEESIDRAARHAADSIEPTPQLRASTEYKQHLAIALSRRALRRAAGYGPLAGTS